MPNGNRRLFADQRTERGVAQHLRERAALAIKEGTLLVIVFVNKYN